MTEAKTKKFQVKRWMKICGGVFAAIVLFFLLLPFGMKYYLADWLEKNGADSAVVKNLTFNPFAGRITLGGMEAKRGGQSMLNHAHVVLDLGITSLFNRDIRIEKAEYREFFIDIEQYQDGSWRFGTYTLQGQRKEEKVESGEEALSNWRYLADKLILKDCKVRLKTPDFDMTLVIDEAELTRFTTREEQPAGSFIFNGKLNDGPIVLKLDTVRVAPEVNIGGTVSIAGFQLAELSKLLRDVLPTLAGEVGLDGQLLFSQDAEKGLQVDYDGTFGLTGMNIGSSDFSSRAESFTWTGKLHYGAEKDSPAKIETEGLLAAQKFNFAVPASELALEESRIDLNGKTTVTLGENIMIENDGSLLLEGTKFVLPPYGITEERIAWKGRTQYEAKSQDEGKFVRVDGELDLGEFQVEGGDESAPFGLGGKMVSWQGVVGFSQIDSGKRSILELDGSLTGGELRTTLEKPQLRLGQDKVELKTKATISLGENIKIDGLSSFTLQNFALFEGENDSPSLSFNQLAITDIESRGEKTIGVKDLQTVGLKSSIPGDFPLSIDISEIKLADLFTEDLKNVTVRELQVKNPLVTALHNNAELVRLDDLAVTNISVGEEMQVGLDNVQLQNLAFLGSPEDQAKKPAVSFAGASLNEMSWSKSAGLEGNTLQFDDLVASVVRNKDGKINISQQLAEMQQGSEQGAKPAGKVAQEPAAAQATQEKTAAAPLKLGKIVVAGKSAVSFEDYTLKEPYKTDLAISRLEITGLDSGKPDQKTAVAFEGELEKRAPIEVTGNIFPFKKKTGVDMKLSLKNYPLSSLSPYTVQAVGTALASGQLQIKSTLKLADDNLDMNNALLLKKLETKTISPELAAELNNQLPIPLDSALSLLRDSDENISLDVPLSGPVNELNVGISDVLITALSKAIVPAASGYLMYALGPYGALAYVGMKVGENMLEISVPPVEFAPQEISLTPKHIDYLQRIGKIMQDRADADLQLCPTVASWEFMTAEEKAAVKGNVIEVDVKKQDELLELGQQRAKAVQSFLAKDYGIAQGRLLICKTQIDKKKDAVPAVVLQL